MYTVLHLLHMYLPLLILVNTLHRHFSQPIAFPSLSSSCTIVFTFSILSYSFFRILPTLFMLPLTFSLSISFYTSHWLHCGSCYMLLTVCHICISVYFLFSQFLSLITYYIIYLYCLIIYYVSLCITFSIHLFILCSFLYVFLIFLKQFLNYPFNVGSYLQINLISVSHKPC